MALKIIQGAAFPCLEQKLLRDLRDDSAAVQWVITPTAAVANHLRRRLVESVVAGVLAGIRVIPLTHFLSRLLQAAQMDAGERQGPLLDLLLHQLTRQSADLQIVRHLADIPAGGRFLMPTFLDLGDGGFGPAQQELILELAAEPDLSSVESEVLRLYCQWLDLLGKTAVRWAPLQAQKLCQALDELPDAQLLQALACESDRTPRLRFHGFYEFTDVNTQILAALSRRLDIRLYYPFAPSPEKRKGHPAFAFTLPILEDFQFRLGTALESTETVDGIAPETPAEFFLEQFPEGRPSEQPDFLSWQRASGIRAEAVSAALRIRRWLDEDSRLQPSDILVTASTITPYLAALREVFRQFALPLRILEAPGGLEVQHKALRSLGRIWQQDAASEWLLPHLRDFHSGDPLWAGFEEKVRERGIWGASAWRRALQAESPDDDRAGWNEDQRHRVEQIAQLAEEHGSRRRADLDPAQALRLLKELAFLQPQREGLAELQQAVERLSERLPEGTVPTSWLQDCLLEAGANRHLSDSWNRQGVLFAPLMRSRGLTARRLVVLGLACGQLPLRIEEDPLLSDPARRRLAALARDVGHRLPVKTRAAEEQTLLFFLINTSAEKVHWVIPESDETGRQAAPTPWVQRFLKQWQTQAALQSSALQRGPRHQAAELLKADPEEGRYLPPSFACLLGSAPKTGRPRTRPRPTRPPSSLSVTALEALARCPFRFHALFVSRWTPLEPLLPFRAPSAMERGRLLHLAMERLLADCPEQGIPLSAAARDLLRGNGKRLRDAVHRAVEDAYSTQVFPQNLLQEAAAESLIRTLSAYFEQAAREEEIHVEALESERSRGFPAAGGVTVKGKIDRVDRKDFGTRRIIDYKSGRKPSQLDAEVRAGFRLQPVLYPWLFQLQDAGSELGEEAAFAYVFLGDDPPQTHSQDDAPSVGDMLGPLSDLLQQGGFFPTSNQVWQGLELPLQPCRGCGLASLCRRHDPGQSKRSARLFRKKGKSRLDFLRDQLL